jgi:hypothetical protein
MLHGPGESYSDVIIRLAAVGHDAQASADFLFLAR